MLGLEAGRCQINIRGENRLGAGAPLLSFSYYSQLNLQFANIRHLQLQGRQNTTIEVNLRLF